MIKVQDHNQTANPIRKSMRTQVKTPMKTIPKMKTPKVIKAKNKY
jgi:hypothetical protein